MSEIARGRRQEERLPWLEPVEEEDDDSGSGIGHVILLVGIALLLIGAIAYGAYHFMEGGGDDVAGTGELIKAPAQPYREKPRNAGGMEVEGTGQLAYSASDGADIDSAIDLTALPEAPVTGPGSETGADIPMAVRTPPPAKPVAKAAIEKTPVAAPPAKPVAPPAPVETAEAEPVSGGGSIQLGAFSSEAKAKSAWKSLSGRFGFLSPLTSMVLPVKTDNGTLYRLRAGAGGQADSLCQRLKVAGESCSVVN
jgi:cell division septation protein DedD